MNEREGSAVKHWFNHCKCAISLKCWKHTVPLLIVDVSVGSCMVRPCRCYYIGLHGQAHAHRIAMLFFNVINRQFNMPQVALRWLEYSHASQGCVGIHVANASLKVGRCRRVCRQPAVGSDRLTTDMVHATATASPADRICSVANDNGEQLQACCTLHLNSKLSVLHIIIIVLSSCWSEIITTYTPLHMLFFFINALYLFIMIWWYDELHHCTFCISICVNFVCLFVCY